MQLFGNNPITTVMHYTLIDNTERKRFEYQLDDEHVAVVEYIKTKDKFYLTHTEVPKAFEGSGIASALVKDVLQEVERSGLPLMPLCPYVAAYLKRHPEWKRLLADNVRI